MTEDIKRAAMLAAEEAVIAGLPPELLERMKVADAEYAAKGGCPGCGYKIIGVHAGNCPANANDCY